MPAPVSRRKLNQFAKKVGRGIHRFRMIEDGDRVLIAASGGKDSLALSVALAERRKWVPIEYGLEAAFVEWKEYPLPDEEKERIAVFYEGWGIPLHFLSASMFPDSFRGRFDCYLCSRNRRRILFQEAERLGCRKIALGHHQDDIIETTLMNILFRGEFATMMPVQDFFGGRLQIIRPMCEVREKEVVRFCRQHEVPRLDNPCPRKDVNRRVAIKEIVRGLERINRNVGENIYRTPWNINTEYLPTFLNT